jgi:hypothetical protein
MRRGEDTMEQKSLGPERIYERPELRVLGTVQELTHVDKMFGLTDGNTLLGIPITNNSTTH